MEPAPGPSTRRWTVWLLPLALVLFSGLAVAVASQLRWAMKRGWPEVAPKGRHGLADRLPVAAAVGPLVALGAWLALIAAVRRVNSSARPSLAWRTARPFALGWVTPLLAFHAGAWQVGMSILALATAAGVLYSAGGSLAGVRDLGRKSWVEAIRWRDILRPAARCAFAVEGPLLFLLAVHLALWVPTIGRAAENPRRLAAYTNDEPMIVQQMVGMTSWPYGNPANAMRDANGLGPEWDGIRYYGVYYGGVYLGLSSVLWLPLRLCGFPDFPTAPILLRGVSIAAGALCVIVLYNFAKKCHGGLVAFLGCLLLVLDGGFGFYTCIVHPDILQLALTFLALWVAVQHAGQGDRDSLIGLGVLAGLVQGTKLGGPPLVPMALVAVVWGGVSARTWTLRSCWGGRELYARLVLLGATSLAAWVVSTPYAFLDSYFFKLWTAAWSRYQEGLIAPATLRGWLDAFWIDQGPWLFVLEIAGLVFAAVRTIRGTVPRAPLVLTAILGLSWLAWTIRVVKVWIVPSYALPGIALAGLLAAHLLGWVVERIRARGVAGRRLGAGLAVSVIGAVLLLRGVPALSQALRLSTLDRSTVVEAGRWVRANVPLDAKLLVDDICYIDPAYRRFTLHGGLLTHADLNREKPDYFILCGSIFEAPHYIALRRTQSYERGKEGPISLLLYQDLLDRGGVPECELLATISGAPLPVGDSLPFGLHVLIAEARQAFGSDPILTGPTIKVYRTSN